MIIGATGLVGRRLLRHFKQTAHTVLGTARRPEADLLPLDLAAPPTRADWLPSARSGLAVVAAAQTKADVCESDPVGTRRINVDGTIHVLRQLQAAGFMPVYLSSDYVFGADGATEYVESSPTCPTNEYGRQKVEVEQFLQSTGKDYLILRLGRVLTDEPGGGCVLDEACRRLLSGTVYRAAHDQWFSTVYVEDVARVIEYAARHGRRNIIHAATSPTNRYELVREIGRRLGTDSGLVQSCSIDDVPGSAKRPKRTVIVPQRLNEAKDFAFTDVQTVIERMTTTYRTMRS